MTASVTNPTATPTFALQGVAPLPHLGVIRVAGSDAASFLQGQLTQDFVLLGAAESRLAAFCSAKGRMQASFTGFKRDNLAGETEILLICSHDILTATLKRLSMFVMRAKAKLTDATGDFQLLGLAGDSVAATAKFAMHSVAGNAYNTGAICYFDHQTVVFMPSVQGSQRALWLAPVGVPVPAGEPLSQPLWQWGEVQSGIATITAPIVDAFVPQMLNYESVGGVNFKKGCYPGQEVVARSQFRGTLKRRAYLVHCAVPMAAGDAVFGPADAEQPCGTVAQAAEAPQGGFDAIVAMQVAAAAAGGLTLAAAGGASIALLALPYALLEDI